MGGTCAINTLIARVDVVEGVCVGVGVVDAVAVSVESELLIEEREGVFVEIKDTVGSIDSVEGGDRMALTETDLLRDTEDVCVRLL
jgi:hypothetical protein